jgi:hypothetical protein
MVNPKNVVALPLFTGMASDLNAAVNTVVQYK